MIYTGWRINLVLVTLLLSSVVFGCSPRLLSTDTPPPPTELLTPSVSQISSNVTKTVTPPSATATYIYIDVPPKTFTPTPTLSPSPVLPTFTPRPTLDEQETRELVGELIQTNGGCELPCWWGYTPGVTSWNLAYGFLDSLYSDIYITDPDIDGSYFAFVRTLAPEDLSSIAIEHAYWVKDNVIQFMKIDPGHSPGYSFTSLISALGQPDGVWLRTYSEGYRGELPFQLIVFYAQKGILAGYTVMGQNLSSSIQGCPAEGTRPVLGLWSPVNEMPFDTVVDLLDVGIEEWPFMPIEDVTDLNTEMFYQLFSDPASTPCISTPANLWDPMF